jgi:hypothetical protein
MDRKFKTPHLRERHAAKADWEEKKPGVSLILAD